jgi:hypothetical protein
MVWLRLKIIFGEGRLVGQLGDVVFLEGDGRHGCELQGGRALYEGWRECGGQYPIFAGWMYV